MSETNAETLEAVFHETRRLFHVLRAIGDELHADSAITTAMRGVLESLATQGAQTVPQMARARPVSRQHIQTIVDALVRRGLVELVANPSHKRSPLVRLTEAGTAAFARLHAAEARLLAQAAPTVSMQELETAARVLAALNLYFRSAEWALVRAHSSLGGA